MQFQVKTKKGIVRRKLCLVKTGASKYVVRVDDEQREIGTIWKADGQVKKFRNHLLDGTHFIDRWFALTATGEKLGPQPPYDEGFRTRREALIELMEKTLKITSEWR